MSVSNCLTWQRSSNIGAAIYWVSLDLMIALHDCITAEEYEAILQNQVHPVVQMLLPRDVPLHDNGSAMIHAA